MPRRLVPPSTATGSANSATTATIAAVSGRILHGLLCVYSYSAAPTAGKLQIKDGSTVILEVDITATGPGFIPLTGFNASSGGALSAVLAAGGGTTVGKVSLSAELLD